MTIICRSCVTYRRKLGEVEVLGQDSLLEPEDHGCGQYDRRHENVGAAGVTHRDYATYLVGSHFRAEAQLRLPILRSIRLLR